MASRREYELLFQLNASLNGGFSASFQKAQQKIVELQREIDKLSKIQADIGAYEKQQAAVEKTASKLEMLKKQHDNIQREYEQTGEASSDLQNKLLAKEEQIKNTSRALEEQQKKLEATGDALKEAGVDTANLTEESKRLEEEMGALKDQQEETAKNAQTFGDKAVQAFEAAGNALIAAGIMDGLKKVYDGFMDCVSVTADFQESMSNVKALSQASNSEMSALSGLAKELGATTKFTAKQSADAMGYMAMAGWTAEDMLQGLPGVMSLAAASGEDLAMVSDIVTDSLSGFGLTAADSAHYADILAAAATSANTNVAYMGDTFKYAASVAGALNVSAEDTAEAIGVMANAGIKGSMAGSSLRSILLRLATDAGASSTKLGALGVLTEELGVNFYDAEGNVRDFTTVLDETRVAWSKLSAEEQASYGKTIAGQYAVSGWLALMNATPDSIDKVRYSIDNCTGAAERMSKIKLDNLNGQIALFDSAWEAVQTTVGEQATPALQGLYGAGTALLTGINEFLTKNPELIRGITAGAAGLGAVAGVITAVAAVSKVAVAWMGMLTASIPGVGWILGIGGALSAVAATLAMTSSEADDASYAFREQQKELERLNGEYETACEVHGKTSSEANTLRYRIMDLTAEMNANGGSIKGLIQDYEDLMNRVSASKSEYQSASGQYENEALDALALTQKLRDLADAYKETGGGKEVMASLVEQLNGSMDGILNIDLETVINGGDDWQKRLADDIEGQAADSKKTLKQKRLVDVYHQISDVEVSRDVRSRELEAAERAMSEMRAQVNGAAEQGLDIGFQLVAPSKQIKECKEELDGLQKTLEELTSEKHALEVELGVSFEGLTEAEKAEKRFQNALEFTEGALGRLAASYQETYDAASKSVKEQFDLWEKVDKIVPTTVSDMTSALQSQIDYWDEYSRNLAYLESLAPQVEGLSDLLPQLSDGSEKSAAAVAGMASSAKNGLGDLQRMTDKVAELEAKEKSVTDQMALTVSGFDEQSRKLVEDFEKTVQDMDMSQLAEVSAANTLQGFINRAAQMEGAVSGAYEKVAKSAVQAMERQFNNFSANIKWPSVPTPSVPGYAVGTTDAAPGPALVGEQGPELLYMRGGETVITADKTREIIREASRAETQLLKLEKLFRIEKASHDSHSSAETLNRLEQFDSVYHHYASGTNYALKGSAVAGEYGPEIVIPAAWNFPSITFDNWEALLPEEPAQRVPASILNTSPFFLGDMPENRGFSDFRYAENALSDRARALSPLYALSERIPPVLYAETAPLSAVPAPAPLSALPVSNTGSAGGDGTQIVVHINYSPTISGVSSPEELETVLREHSQDIAEQVAEVLRNMELDRKRGAYA